MLERLLMRTVHRVGTVMTGTDAACVVGWERRWSNSDSQYGPRIMRKAACLAYALVFLRCQTTLNS